MRNCQRPERPEDSLVYANRTEELDQYRFLIKLKPCPHCGAVGYLICHGYLKGFGRKGHQRIRRGCRFFCSNRDRRQGCGRTFSVLLAAFLRRHMVPATMVWGFLQGVRSGMKRKAAWEEGCGGFALETGYRLWDRLTMAQGAIRSRLSRLMRPPRVESREPVFQMIEHLRRAFPHAACPISAYHVRFQRSLLE